MINEKKSVRDQYLEQMVEGASREKLLLMLVDGAVNFIRRAIFSFDQDKLDEVHNNLIKAQNIYLELTLSLDLDAGEFAENIALIYQYLYNLLIEANIDKDKEKIEVALKVAIDLRNLWKDAVEKAKEDPAFSGSKPLNANVPPVDPASIEKPKSTGVYQPVAGSQIVEEKSSGEEITPRLNITG